MKESHSPNYELTLLFSMAFRTALEELHTELEQRGFGDVRPSHGFVFQRLAAHGATGIELAQHGNHETSSQPYGRLLGGARLCEERAASNRPKR